MKSFPSAFTKNKLVQEGLASTNIKQTLQNIAGSAMNNMLSGSGNDDAKNRKELGERLEWKEYNFADSLSIVNFTRGNEISIQDNSVSIYNNNSNRPIYENANKIPALELAAINKYRKIFKSSAIQYGQSGKEKKDDKEYKQETYQEAVSQSLFNPWFGVRSQGFTLNSPLMYLHKDTVATVNFEENESKTVPVQVPLNNFDGDFTDCSIRTLVNLQDNKGYDGKRDIGPGGVYRYADFMYCKELGKISNNHLITLRRFTHPVGDNIFKIAASGDTEFLPDKGRLVTWFGTEDNKLEDICKFNFKATWKEFESKIQDVQSKEDNNKLLPSLINLSNSGYRNMFRNGQVGNNAYYQWAAGKVSFFGFKPFEAQSSEASDNDRYYRDSRLVWTPKNTIQKTHIYEGKIEFNHQFKLTFNYELRSYDGINPKSAFLDLIGNILEVTHRRGKYWGGSRRWLGAPRNEQGWKRANQLFDKLESGTMDGLDSLFGCGSWEDLVSLCGQWLNSAIGWTSGMIDKAKEVVQSPDFKDKTKKVVKNVTKDAIGMLKNKLGRPAVYALDAIGSGANVGLWHVTIGNPRNPIMTMGNLILDDASIQQYGVLGIDDFPTGLKVEITLKHARPRDITDIASMYTCGQGGLLLSLNDKGFKKYFDLNNADDTRDIGLGGLGTKEILGVEDCDSVNEYGMQVVEEEYAKDYVTTGKGKDAKTKAVTSKREAKKAPDNSLIASLWANLNG